MTADSRDQIDGKIQTKGKDNMYTKDTVTVDLRGNVDAMTNRRKDTGIPKDTTDLRSD